VGGFLQDWRPSLIFERFAYRGEALEFARFDWEREPRDFDDSPDLIIDLAGGLGDDGRADARVLSFVVNGLGGEAGLVAALLAESPPRLHLLMIQGREPPRALKTARLAVEHSHSIALSLQQILPRLVTLIVQSVERDQNAEVEAVPSSSATLPPRISPARFAIAKLGEKIAARIDRLVRISDHWRIAWRRTTGEADSIAQRFAWPSDARWEILADDRRRYYADPFLFTQAGKNYLFCEEVAYAIGKGIIAYTEIYLDGRIAAPLQPIIETDSHLSWPYVFAQGDAIYMLPEASQSGEIALWRADPFPHRWVKESVLVADLIAVDPMIYFSGNCYFLLTNTSGDGGSKWDALSLFFASSLKGPWRAHPENPLLVDSTCTRSGGPFFHRGRELWRVAQDCSEGYGKRLTLCRVSRLDETGYAQDRIVTLHPPTTLHCQGVHTLSMMKGFDAIDFRAPLGR